MTFVCFLSFGFGSEMERLDGEFQSSPFHSFNKKVCELFMETTAHFDKIAACIGSCLRNAKEEIVVAVAWFTDSELFDILCRQAGKGLRVRLAVLDDKINVGAGRLNFCRLKEVGGEVVLVPCKGGAGPPIMHHKFCVIDGATVIVGSYNWTKRAQANDESILVLSNAHELASEYLNAFLALLQKYKIDVASADSVEIRQCLELIGGLIRLGEWSLLAVQIEKFAAVTKNERFSPLLSMLQRREYKESKVWMDDYLSRSSALAVSADHDVPALRLILRGLELYITALSAEKVELERLINAFNLRSSYELGDLMGQYLGLQYEKLRRKCEVDPDDCSARSKAEKCRSDYDEYKDAERNARKGRNPVRLSPDDTSAIRRLYREASQRCHPDKCVVAERARASDLFVQLNAAYKANDLPGVMAIHAVVKERGVFTDVADVITESEALGFAVIELRQGVQKLSFEIARLRESDAYIAFCGLGDWDSYFDQQKVVLARAIDDLRMELSC